MGNYFGWTVMQSLSVYSKFDGGQRFYKML